MFVTLQCNEDLKFESHTDDTSTFFVFGKNFDHILIELDKHVTSISEWFLHNCLKGNAKKFHLLISLFVDKPVKHWRL